MGLSSATLPGAIGDIHFGIGALTGMDWVRSLVLPEKYLLRSIGRKVFDHLVKSGAQLELRRITFAMPDGRTFEIVRLIKSGEKAVFLVIVPWRGGA